MKQKNITLSSQENNWYTFSKAAEKLDISPKELYILLDYSGVLSPQLDAYKYFQKKEIFMYEEFEYTSEDGEGIEFNFDHPLMISEKGLDHIKRLPLFKEPLPYEID